MIVLMMILMISFFKVHMHVYITVTVVVKCCYWNSCGSVVKAMDCHPGDMGSIAVVAYMSQWRYYEGHPVEIALVLQKMSHVRAGHMEVLKCRVHVVEVHLLLLLLLLTFSAVSSGNIGIYQ